MRPVTLFTGEWADLPYHSVAPTLHWSYAAAVGRDTRFAEVREADLTPLAGGGGGGIVKFTTKSLVVKEPAGVVAVLCAYNFALPCVGQKAGPALVAGCTVVLKVPDPDPPAIFALGDLITEAGFPAGVINIIAAGPEESQHLVKHPDMNMVSFTGSTAQGGVPHGHCRQRRCQPAALAAEFSRIHAGRGYADHRVHRDRRHGVHRRPS